ncbi:NADH-quinone oxidoreductase subunit NuoE [Spirochaeta isovalerica]|uniref:NADH:ubiquinone oxidoreductase subunit E n=1 Tax=Spirochaeta isovalerica TaxID=150 RepID=A0A841R5A5_9SPIO|nr:NADH-quinone oxidoreductase subunit NuoE [Spirochaeta isovalerica]MBB6480344.1 NADH:ubiquinone oxidoreductase subunit E [Spirochaeta isovalerica]
MTQTQLHVQQIIRKHGPAREKLLPILQDVVKEQNYLSESAMKQIAAALDISAAEVYGVATFYSFLNTGPTGRYTIRICKSVSCDSSGRKAVAETLEKRLRIKMGETTPDGLFTLQHINCMGWCHKSPAMLINEKVYTELTPEKTAEALNEWLAIAEEERDA